MKGLGLWFLLAIPSTYTNSMVCLYFPARFVYVHFWGPQPTLRTAPFVGVYPTPAQRSGFMLGLKIQDVRWCPHQTELSFPPHVRYPKRVFNLSLRSATSNHLSR